MRVRFSPSAWKVLAMVPDFVPIIDSRVDWLNFLTCADKALGRSVSASLDAKNLQPIGLPPFISATKEFKKPGSDAIKAFRECLNGQHVYIGFLIVCDKETLRDLPTKHIDVTITDGLDCSVIIASGSMYSWYFFLLSCLAEHTIKNTRILAVKLMLYLDRNDLGECFANFNRIPLDDGTYILEIK